MVNEKMLAGMLINNWKIQELRKFAIQFEFKNINFK